MFINFKKLQFLVMENIILWHRRDLRIIDNVAFFKAQKITKNVFPIFIIDPIFFETKDLDTKTNPDRILFMIDCLKKLDNEYRKIGSKLSIVFGDSFLKILELQKKFDAKIFYNFDTNMRIGKLRDDKIKNYKNFFGFNNDGVLRDKNITYEKEKIYTHIYFNSQILKPECCLEKNKIPCEITFDDLVKKYNIKKEKDVFEKAGREYVFDRLDFFSKNLTNYMKSISKPFNSINFCSRISANLSFGVISIREVYNFIKESKNSQVSKNFYLSRLIWHEHFYNRLEQFSKITYEEKNLEFKNLHKSNFDKTIQRKFFKAQTGFPIVDSSIICLKKTGWINFRSRAMLSTFFTHILKQPWKNGADWMHYHLLDSDSAINYSQWQMHSGVGGFHPLRLYNPDKLLLEKDSDMKFVKKFLPIFKDVKEIEYLTRPQNYSNELKEKYNIDVQKDYFNLIEDYEKEAKEFFKSHLQKVNRIAPNQNFRKPKKKIVKKNSNQKSIFDF